MAPTALIAVAREADGAPDGLAALLPVAGHPLVEHQARRAAAAGAGALVLVAASIRPGLAVAAERLRRSGLPVAVALGAADAMVKAGEGPLLLIADAVLPSEAALHAVVAAGAPALLVLPDAPAHAIWERLDADSRWSGAALLPPGRLAAAATMPSEWDLELVLVRTVVGTAARVAAREDAVTRVTDPDAARRAGDAMIPAGPAPERALIAALAARRIDARALRVAALAAAWAGAALAGVGPLLAALPLLVAAAPLDRVGRRLASVRLEPARHGRGWRHGRLAAMAAALGLYGWRLSGAPGYEPLLLAASAILLLVVGRNQALIAGVRPSRWSARPTPMLWLATPPALAGQGRWALAALAAWTAASLLHLQWRALKARRPPHQDSPPS